MSVCTVVVAHRQAMVAEGLAAALGRYPGIATVGLATSPSEVVRLGRGADAVAIDTDMPEAESAAGRLRGLGIRVVFIGGDDSDGESVRVSTEERIASLAAALNPNGGPAHPRTGHLTNRESEVLTLVARGLAGKQVARQLGISPKTVERHKTKIFSKLGVPNAAAAVGLFLSRSSGGDRAWT
jgi:DNA-binding NarL/FixJ family response regulator